jgi:hypothetical protein
VTNVYIAPTVTPTIKTFQNIDSLLCGKPTSTNAHKCLPGSVIPAPPLVNADELREGLSGPF